MHTLNQSALPFRVTTVHSGGNVYDAVVLELSEAHSYLRDANQNCLALRQALLEAGAPAWVTTDNVEVVMDPDDVYIVHHMPRRIQARGLGAEA